MRRNLFQGRTLAGSSLLTFTSWHVCRDL